MQKLYAYVDESGQDTEGQIFVIGIIVLEEERHHLKTYLESIEETSGKRNIKWRKAKYKSRVTYIEAIAQSALLHGKIFFETFTNTKKYLEMTAYATAKAVLQRVQRDDYVVTVFVDGLRKGEMPQFARGLRDLHIKRRKIRGVRKDENNSLIRLADAVCGLVRDARDGNDWAHSVLQKLEKREIIVGL